LKNIDFFLIFFAFILDIEHKSSILNQKATVFNYHPNGGVFMAEQGYCVKCKAKKEIKGAQKVKMKNGRPAMKGVCPSCGTVMYKILSSK